MAIFWRRAAAALLCAVCGAAAGQSVLSTISNRSDIRSALRRTVSPTIEPASAAAVVDPAVIIRLRAPDELLPEEEDLLPPPAPWRDAATHTVVAGDTLWVIATSAGIRVDALAAANDLSEAAILSVGRVLIIPEADAGAPASAPAAVGRTAAASRLRTAEVSSAAPASEAQRQGTAASVAMLWPSRGIVTSRFGWRVHPIFGSREFHTGMDIATHYGSPVVAARAGLVTFVGWKTGYGRIILVKHDGGFETAYSHLSAALVGPGERVARGQVIGRIGNSGWSTGPHLFFEIRRNGVPVDPARYLN